MNKNIQKLEIHDKQPALSDHRNNKTTNIPSDKPHDEVKPISPLACAAYEGNSQRFHDLIQKEDAKVSIDDGGKSIYDWCQLGWRYCRQTYRHQKKELGQDEKEKLKNLENSFNVKKSSYQAIIETIVKELIWAREAETISHLHGTVIQAKKRQGGVGIGNIVELSPWVEASTVFKKLTAYLQGGANAISVLTDPCGFNGSVEDLIAARAVASQYHCPVLRKDFIIDEVQIAQSILMGTDAMLLIVNFIGEKTAALFQCAQKLGIDVVVEVFDRDELDYALSFGADIIAVNNRYLRSMTIDTQNALRLIPHIPQNVIKIAASGIEDIHTAHGFFNAGYNAVLMGTSLMKHAMPSHIIQAIKEQPAHATTD